MRERKRRISKSELEQVLHGDIELISQIKNFDFPLTDVKVIIWPYHVRKILLDYLQLKITAQELQYWAEFICYHFCSYVIHNPEYTEEIMAYYAEMLHVIEKLSTPEIDFEITPETVLRYLSELKKYKIN